VSPRYRNGGGNRILNPPPVPWALKEIVRMASFVVLVQWTERGIQDARETLERARQVGALAEQMGGRLTTLLWTQGAYDLVGIAEFPDDETFAAFALAVGMRGATRTESLRAFTAEEMGRILEKLPRA
jgi:uncharacterized protein with GYD domain